MYYLIMAVSLFMLAGWHVHAKAWGFAAFFGGMGFVFIAQFIKY